MKIIPLCILLSVSVVTAAETQPAKTEAPAKAMEIVHVDAAQAKKLLDASSTKPAAKEAQITVIDVRTPEEYAAARLGGAKLIDIGSDTFAADVAKLDRKPTYLVHCAAGGRSTKALETFKKLGFKKVIHLDGGINAWKKAGFPVESGK